MDRQGGKCYYCNRPIFLDQKKALVEMDIRLPMSMENAAYIHERCQNNEMKYIGYIGNPYDLHDMDVLRLLEEVSRIQDCIHKYHCTGFQEVSAAHAFCIHRKYLFFNVLADTGLVLLDDLRLKLTYLKKTAATLQSD